VSSQSGIKPRRSKYRLLGLVGQGQFGRVFCAAHRQTGRLVALKNLEQQRFSTHRFLRELRFLLSLQHPNIVTCQALEHTATGRYLVMDYCEGGTLRNLMSEELGLSLPQSLELVADILAALEHAHSRGIVHCDIKPENILLNCQSTGWMARVSDFGIARLIQELTALGMGTGSPAYMAPERFYGQYSPASDLYSVGIILFELISGHRPFSGTPQELMSAHLNRPVQLDAIPEVWRSFVLTALQKLPARRFRSATEMLSALRSIAAADSVSLAAQSVVLPPAQIREPQSLKIEWQEPLRQRVQCLAVAQNNRSNSADNQAGIYRFRAENAQVVITPHVPIADGQSQARIALPTRIRALLPRPQGCFAVAQDALYRLPTADETSPCSIRTLAANSQVAIEAGGRWLAHSSTDSDGINFLTFQLLSPGKSSVAVASRPISLVVKADFSLRQIIALDSRHVAVVFTKTNGSTTRLEIFNRRGCRVGALMLPIAVKQAIVTPILYRLLAVEQDNNQPLLIDLKPFRISRLRVRILPQFLTALPWGYSITDFEGQMVFLDLFGQYLSQIEGPAHSTAIAPVNSHQLLVANWSTNQGSLYTLNLKNLDVGLVF